MLYVVSTPIGNIKDMTYRAVETLNNVDYILAEDTRRTGILLKAYSITKPMVSFNEVSEKHKTLHVIKDLNAGKDIAIVSDAGTPLVSDPGFVLIRECTKNNIPVSPVPGASAILSALVCSGLPASKFTFYGFLPKERGKRKKMLSAIKEKKETAILYESPYRLLSAVADIAGIMPASNVVVAREMTKKFEEFIRGNVAEVHEKIMKKNIKGEIVIIISPEY